jgi:deoxyhypusine synthase
MLVPNSNYCLFEDWIMPLLDDMLKEQQEQGTVWTPSKVSLTEHSAAGP